MQDRSKVQDLKSFSVPDGFRGRAGGYVLLWWLVQSTLFAMSPQPFYRWRAFLLRLFGAEIGQNVILRPSMRVTYPWKIKIGDNAWIGDRAELYSLLEIEIGEDTCISQDCYICTGSHDFRDPEFPYDCRPVLIGDQCWLAAGCFVGPGVTIGSETVVGARSLVLTDLEENSIYAGHPAKRRGPRSIPS